MHKPFINVPSREGKILLLPLRLHMHIRVPIKPTIYRKKFKEISSYKENRAFYIFIKSTLSINHKATAFDSFNLPYSHQNQNQLEEPNLAGNALPNICSFLMTRDARPSIITMKRLVE